MIAAATESSFSCRFVASYEAAPTPQPLYVANVHFVA